MLDMRVRSIAMAGSTPGDAIVGGHLRHCVHKRRGVAGDGIRDGRVFGNIG